MKYYAVAELNVTDRGWARDYIATVTPLVEKYGSADLLQE
jgi:uncharacterized protein (DUF1330 family)